MNMLRSSALVVALFAALPGAASAGDGYKIIVHGEQKVGKLSKEEVSRIFLKKQTRWADGAEIRVVQPRLDSTVRHAFDPSVHHLPPAAVRAYWSQMVFSGRDVPPVEKASDDAIVEFVKQNAGAIGVVSDDAPVSGVKVVELK
jgi:ABC-type phosphate transport system substrate-binding protein